jgi:hypothetical protein
MQQEIAEISSRLNSLAMEIEGMSREPEHKHEHVGKGKDHPHKEE